MRERGLQLLLLKIIEDNSKNFAHGKRGLKSLSVGAEYGFLSALLLFQILNPEKKAFKMQWKIQEKHDRMKRSKRPRCLKNTRG